MRGDWCSIYATLRKRNGEECDARGRGGGGGGGRVHKILSMDTKRAALKDDRFEFIDDHRQRRRGASHLDDAMMERKRKKRRGKNDREMIPSKGASKSRTMEKGCLVWNYCCKLYDCRDLCGRCVECVE